MLENKKFNKAMINLMKELNSTELAESEYSLYSYRLETKAGILCISFKRLERSNLYAIQSKFDDPKLAYSVLGNHYMLNSYSGKFNFYNTDVTTLILVFKQEIEKIQL